MPFFTAPATATPAGCRLFASYGEEITSCEDNTVLGNAALACVRGYYNRVQSAQKDVLAKFQEQIAKMKEQQNDTFDRTQSGYEDSRKKLEALIAEGHEVRAVVDDLYLNLAFPPDAEEESFTGQSTESYLAQEDCYAIPQRVMIQSQQMTDKIVSDLEAVMAAALGKEYRAQNRSAHVQIGRAHV